MIIASPWVICWERNQRIFEGKEMIFEDLFENAKYLASTWASTDPSFI